MTLPGKRETVYNNPAFILDHGALPCGIRTRAVLVGVVFGAKEDFISHPLTRGYYEIEKKTCNRKDIRTGRNAPKHVRNSFFLPSIQNAMIQKCCGMKRNNPMMPFFTLLSSSLPFAVVRKGYLVCQSANALMRCGFQRVGWTNRAPNRRYHPILWLFPRVVDQARCRN